MKIKTGDGGEIALLDKFLRLRGLFKRLQQISWNVTAAEKRYPSFESLTTSELENMYKMYLALSFDISDIDSELKKEYKKYKNGGSKDGKTTGE